jgi:hypothetical protein
MNTTSGSYSFCFFLKIFDTSLFQASITSPFACFVNWIFPAFTANPLEFKLKPLFGGIKFCLIQAVLASCFMFDRWLFSANYTQISFEQLFSLLPLAVAIVNYTLLTISFAIDCWSDMAIRTKTKLQRFFSSVFVSSLSVINTFLTVCFAFDFKATALFAFLHIIHDGL